jgi:hypothetical protein
MRRRESLVPEGAVEALGWIYRDHDVALSRTRSRPAVDGGILLLAIVDELRRLREAVEGKPEASGSGERRPAR